jgi:hypothetical protein
MRDCAHVGEIAANQNLAICLDTNGAHSIGRVGIESGINCAIQIQPGDAVAAY